ncbi:unnamed protein product [Cylicocyclus nassatus]|uniref:Uncharacterized protein n=1 Tax=Cylicocyclus nassatus TaxID=53992 RepID=A0AA36GY92_CYLNA|nr:unnamed protein product [Cylicocyclus nassatus]
MTDFLVYLEEVIPQLEHILFPIIESDRFRFSSIPWKFSASNSPKKIRTYFLKSNPCCVRLHISAFEDLDSKVGLDQLHVLS